MDIIAASEAVGTGSIPVGRTFKQKTVLKKNGFFVLSYADFCPLRHIS